VTVIGFNIFGDALREVLDWGHGPHAGMNSEVLHREVIQQ